MIERKKTKQIKVGDVLIGGGAPVSIQSMCSTNTRDIEKTLNQINELYDAGCEICRIAIPDMAAAEVTDRLVASSPIPLIADIHFDYKLALETLKRGIHGLRINPGNIKESEKVKTIVEKAEERQIPIRIGVNAGSINEEKYGFPTAEALVDSALDHVKILEDLNYTNIKVSLKAHDVETMVKAYQMMSKERDYPLHLGVTEAGTIFQATVKSSIGIGACLLEGIGDTIRVSVTGNPVDEIKVAKEILKSLHLRQFGAEIISCPTCGRCEVNVIDLANKVEEELRKINKPISVAVMGCVVNGPGEAKHADIGLAGGKNGRFVLIKKGEIIDRIDEKDALKRLMEEVEKL
jgi:(E)-4-hydroxy-3-methylbut-2-enyl-diphosphate synthase